MTFVLFAAPALAALQGGHAPTTTGHARLAEPVARSADREQAVRVRLETTDDGLMAVPNGPQASHIITSLLGADGLAMIAPGKGVAQPGERVPLIKLSGSRSPR